jgi:hypothetical protein
MNAAMLLFASRSQLRHLFSTQRARKRVSGSALIFDLQMKLHASLHMLGVSILLPFAHSVGMMQQTLAYPPTFSKQSLYASTSVMNPVFTSSGEGVF